LYRQALYLVRRPPCCNSTARHARLDSSRVDTWWAKWNLGFRCTCWKVIPTRLCHWRNVSLRCIPLTLVPLLGLLLLIIVCTIENFAQNIKTAITWRKLK